MSVFNKNARRVLSYIRYPTAAENGGYDQGVDLPSSPAYSVQATHIAYDCNKCFVATAN